MAGPANDFTALALSASAAISEASHAFENEATSREAVTYGREHLVTAWDILARLARRYAASAEYRAHAEGETGCARPILSDSQFRAALNVVAGQLESNCALGGLGRLRAATVIREWLTENSPSHANLLLAQCETAARMNKKRMDEN